MRYVVAAVLVGLAGPAVAQRAFEPPPQLGDLPNDVRGFPRHGETIGAALGCGLRSQQWAERYRGRVTEAMRRATPSTAVMQQGMQVLGRFEAYGARSADRNRREYCAFAASPEILADADLVVQGVMSLP